MNENADLKGKKSLLILDADPFRAQKDFEEVFARLTKNTQG